MEVNPIGSPPFFSYVRTPELHLLECKSLHICPHPCPRPTSSSNNQVWIQIWQAFPSLPISQSWWRGTRGFSAIASAKADEDPDFRIFEQFWFPELSSSLALLHYFLARSQKHGREGGRFSGFFPDPQAIQTTKPEVKFGMRSPLCQSQRVGGEGPGVFQP